MSALARPRTAAPLPPHEAVARPECADHEDRAHKKHDGRLPLIGVNTFLPKDHGGDIVTGIEPIRSTGAEKGLRTGNVGNVQPLRNGLATASGAPVGAASAATSSPGLTYLQSAARERRNAFESLIEAAKTHSLGQISHALYDVGGEYRRNL